MNTVRRSLAALAAVTTLSAGTLSTVALTAGPASAQGAGSLRQLLATTWKFRLDMTVMSSAPH